MDIKGFIYCKLLVAKVFMSLSYYPHMCEIKNTIIRGKICTQLSEAVLHCPNLRPRIHILRTNGPA